MQRGQKVLNRPHLATDKRALLLGAGQVGAAAIGPVDAQAVVVAAHAERERLDHAGRGLARTVGPIGLLRDLIKALLQLLDLQVQPFQPLAFSAGLPLASAGQAQAQQAAGQQQRPLGPPVPRPVACGAELMGLRGSGDGHGSGREMSPS